MPSAQPAIDRKPATRYGLPTNDVHVATGGHQVDDRGGHRRGQHHRQRLRQPARQQRLPQQADAVERQQQHQRDEQRAPQQHRQRHHEDRVERQRHHQRQARAPSPALRVVELAPHAGDDRWGVTAARGLKGFGHARTIAPQPCPSKAKARAVRRTAAGAVRAPAGARQSARASRRPAAPAARTTPVAACRRCLQVRPGLGAQARALRRRLDAAEQLLRLHAHQRCARRRGSAPRAQQQAPPSG